MERQEIIAGLRQAIERGYSLELAIQSFINSGYNRQDVLDSARNINQTVISRMPISPLPEIQPPKKPTQPQQQAVPQQKPTQLQPQIPTQLKPVQLSPQPKPIQIQPKFQPQPQLPEIPIPKVQPQPLQILTQPKQSKTGLIIFLTILLLILLVILGLFIFAKPQVLDFLSKLGFSM